MEQDKFSLFTDDLALSIMKPSESLLVVLRIFNSFGRISAYKVNLKKSSWISINRYISKNELVH